MLDLKFLRTETEFVKKALLKRMDVVDFDAIFELDDRRRSLIAEGDSMRSKKHLLSKLGDYAHKVETGRRLRQKQQR